MRLKIFIGKTLKTFKEVSKLANSELIGLINVYLNTSNTEDQLKTIIKFGKYAVPEKYKNNTKLVRNFILMLGTYAGEIANLELFIDAKNIGILLQFRDENHHIQ